MQADHPGDLLQLYTYWVALPPSSPLAPILPTPDDARLMALALLRLQDVYNLPAHQVLTSLDQMNHLLTNQVAEGDVGSGNVGLSFTSVLCMTLARWMFFGSCFKEYLGKDQNVFAC